MTPAVSRSPFRAVAHELLNPLASVRGCIETLFDGRTPPAIHDELLDVIRRQSVRLDWLIRAAVIDPPAVPPHMEALDVVPILHDAAELTGATLADESGPARIFTDEKRFRIGVEALLMAMTHGGLPAFVEAGHGRVRVTSTFRDVADDAFAWKVKLARELFRAAGIRMRINTEARGTAATITWEALA